MKTLKKNLKKILSLVLSVSLLIVFVPTSFPEVSALEEALFVNEDGYTYYDVMAGIISLEELYGPLSEDSVPDAVGYEAALAKGHLRRRYDLEEGLYHIVFENTDGSLSSYYFDYPVKRENADGEVKDVSLEISAVEALGGLYAGQQSEVSTAFGLTSNEGILLQNDEVEIKMVPVLPVADPKTITPGMTAIGNIATSNITAIDNKTVSYEYNNSTTIEYSLTYTGFKEDIVLSEYTGQTEYYFTLETNGLTLEKIDDSYFLTENQEIKATLGDIIIFTADERNNTLGYMSHSVIKENEKYIITIHVDEEWLRDEDTAYPIRIDPTVEVANVSGAIEDVTINSNAGSSATSSTIFAGKRDSYGISRILMKFPGLDYENFANSEAITNAYVELRDLMCESEQLQINCFAFGYDWDEDTVSWSDFDPALHGSYLTNRTIHYANGVNQPTPHRYAFTITRAVKEWRAGTRSPDRGLLFKAANETELIHKTFASFNRSSYKPTLVVVYNNELSPVVWDGEYYLNNKHYGKYLAYEPNRFFNTSGMMEDLGDSIKWEVVKVTNGYVIRSVDDTTKYLSVVANTASSGMEVVTHTSGTLPERCIWDFIPTTGGRLIKNVATGKYLYCSASGIYASTNLFAANTASYNTAVWRNADVDYYTDRELQSFSVNDMVLDVGETKTPIFLKTAANGTSNALWGGPENYSYSFTGNGNISQTNGEFTANYPCTSGITIQVSHKPTGLISVFSVEVNPFLIYRTRNSEEYTFEEDSITPFIEEDLHFGQKTTDYLLGGGLYISVSDLCKAGMLDQNIQYTVEERADILKLLGTLLDEQEHRELFYDMVEHFIGGTGESYSHSTLTDEVVNHPFTINYVTAVKNLLINYLSQNNGNIDALYYDENLCYQIANRESHPMVSVMIDNMSASGDECTTQPVYGLSSESPVLTLCIDALQGNKFEIVEYSKTESGFTGVLNFTFYDHFGLDSADLSEPKMNILAAGTNASFRQWYILQHWAQLDCTVQPRPYVTVVEFTIPFSGTF